MKKIILTLLMVPAFVGMLCSCSESKTDAKKLDGKWNIVEVNGNKIEKEGLPTLEFDMNEKKVHGNPGCNLFNSSVTLDDKDVSALTIAPGAMTMMACPDMELEDAVVKAIGEVKAVKAGQTESEMLLVDADGKVLLVLSKN